MTLQITLSKSPSDIRIVDESAAVEAYATAENSAQVAQRIDQVLNSIESQIKEELTTSQSRTQTVQETAITLATNIIRKLGYFDEQVVMLRVRSLIQQACSTEKTPTEIRIHPTCLKDLQEKRSSQPVAGMELLRPDETVKPGECRVDFGDYQWGSDLDRQIDHIESLIRELVDDDQ